jgi:16S rRNA processing protein RimM
LYLKVFKMDFTDIGVIVKPHGLKGEFVVKLEQTDFKIAQTFKTVYLEQFGSKVPYILESVDSLKIDRVKFKVKGIDSSEMAEPLRGIRVFQESDLLPEIDVVDFTGYLVIDAEGNDIGEIIEVIENPAQDILIVQYDGREVMIPLNEDLLLGINQDENLIQIDIPDGLLDL